jgi:hypothetical protein
LVQRLPQFAGDGAELDALVEAAKLSACHHCGAHGTVIGHGFLRGYAEDSSDRVVRGRRFFCSNRGHRKGCGRTVSVLLANWISRFSVALITLWSLFCGLSNDLSVACAVGFGWPQSMRSAYRLARRLRLSALAWRAWLCARSEAPRILAHNPLAQVREHLICELGVSPFSTLQLHFGAALS